MNFGATYLSFGATYLNFLTVYLNFGAIYLNVGAKIENRVFSKGVGRVPGLPIRDCARGCDNCVHTRPQMSAIGVTEKTFFERLY